RFQSVPVRSAAARLGRRGARMSSLARRRIGMTGWRTMSRVRPPAVAGSFYPASPSALAAQVDGWLERATVSVPDRPVALIVPHAGYVYSGPVAAAAYATLRAAWKQPPRVLLLGPCHFLPLRGLAWPDVDTLCTPLGEVPLDEDLRRRAAALK